MHREDLKGFKSMMLHYINQCTAARRNGKLSRRFTKHSLQSICFKFSDTLCGIKHADNSRTRKNGIKLIPDQQFVLRSGTVINLLRHGASPLKSDSTMCCNDAAVRMQGEL